MNNTAWADALWLERCGWLSSRTDTRKFDDALEEDFWEKTAPRYTEDYDLNRDTPLLAEALEKRIEKGSSVIEIGPGSGNFTVKMAPYASHITGVESSAAMLREWRKRMAALGLSSVEAVHAKWEDWEPEKADYVVSVNSLYRIRDIRQAIHKMAQCAGKGILLLRTVQRPFFYELYRQEGLPAEEGEDWLLLPIFLHQEGLYADVTCLRYWGQRRFADFSGAEQCMRDEAGMHFNEKKDSLLKRLKECSSFSNHSLICRQERVTAVIFAKTGSR